MYRWLALIAAVLIAVAFFYGQHVGRTSERAKAAVALQKAQAQVIHAAELASRKEAERLAAETARSNLALQLEDQARAEAVSTPVCLPVSRVLRLNQR